MQLTDAMDKKLIVGVSHLMVVNDRGEMLLQKRSANVFYPNLWNAAAAGHIDAGDTPEGTAVKELQEEMGIVVAEKDIEHVNSFLLKYPEGHGKYHNIFSVRVEGRPDVTYESEEVSDYRWVAVDDLEEEINNHPSNFTMAFVAFAKKYFESC